MCRVVGCERKEKSGGYCSRHLYRFHRYGDPLGTFERKVKPPCRVCDKVSVASGLCAGHYSRLKRTGELRPDDPVRVYGEPIEDRIARLVAAPDKNGCRLWLGHCSDGYGTISTRGRNRGVNRILFEIELGRPLLPSEFVCHHCDNPPCCERSHLYLGSAATNMADMSERGRNPGRPKLDADKVREIRRLGA